jgi:hypothetical protein
MLDAFKKQSCATTIWSGQDVLALRLQPLQHYIYVPQWFRLNSKAFCTVAAYFAALQCWLFNGITRVNHQNAKICEYIFQTQSSFLNFSTHLLQALMLHSCAWNSLIPDVNNDFDLLGFWVQWRFLNLVVTIMAHRFSIAFVWRIPRPLESVDFAISHAFTNSFRRLARGQVVLELTISVWKFLFHLW